MSTSTSSQAPTAPAPPVVADAQVRTPANAATVDASRAKAAGAEHNARDRALAQNGQPADAAAPRRGLRAADEPKSCLIQEADTTQNPADLLEEIRGKGKGSGSGIADDGSVCAPIVRDSGGSIEV